MMSKADVLSLITSFSNGQADSTSISEFYDNTQSDLSRHPWLVGCHLAAVSPNTGEFTLTATEGKLLAVFYDNRLLSRETERSLEQRNPNWRDEFGTPIAYMVEDEPAKTFRTYPVPHLPSKPFSFIYGEPLGRDFPLYSVAYFVTEMRTDVPAWLEMALAWRVMEREYSRESTHRDDNLAQVAQQLSDMLLAMVA